MVVVVTHAKYTRAPAALSGMTDGPPVQVGEQEKQRAGGDAAVGGEAHRRRGARRASVGVCGREFRGTREPRRELHSALLLAS